MGRSIGSAIDYSIIARGLQRAEDVYYGNTRIFNASLGGELGEAVVRESVEAGLENTLREALESGGEEAARQALETAIREAGETAAEIASKEAAEKGWSGAAKTSFVKAAKEAAEVGVRESGESVLEGGGKEIIEGSVEEVAKSGSKSAMRKFAEASYKNYDEAVEFAWKGKGTFLKGTLLVGGLFYGYRAFAATDKTINRIGKTLFGKNWDSDDGGPLTTYGADNPAAAGAVGWAFVIGGLGLCYLLFKPKRVAVVA